MVWTVCGCPGWARLTSLISVVLLCLCANAATADTLACISATYAREAMEDYSYGDEPDLHVRHDATAPYDRNCFLKFDLTSIPSNACITSATLRLYQYDSSYMSDDDWLVVAAYRLLRDWQEGPNGRYQGACWLYRTAGTSNPWYAAGARSSVDRRAGAPDSVVTCYRIPVGGPGRWVEWDVTPSAQYWHRNPTKNYGLCLDKWIEGNYSYDGSEWLYFWSEDYGDPNYRPQLVVTYVIPGSQSPVNLGYNNLELNYWNGDPNITFFWDGSGQVRCDGSTSVSGWGWDGARTTFTLNSSFECTAKIKLENGVVGVPNGTFGFCMWESATKYIRMLGVGYGSQFYEISGQCPAIGCGARHDGSAYWSSYLDDGSPTGPPSGAVTFFSETPSNEQSSYLTWKIRYDKANKIFLAYVIDGSTTKLVTYYTGVDFSNFRIGITHANDLNSVSTRVWARFPDNTPPVPNPMTWAVPPRAVSTSQIDMTATTASDDTPPISYYFTEVTGNPGGSSSHWTENTSYSDAGLSANTRYGYQVKARDSAELPNETQNSTPVAYCYTLIPPPTACRAGSVTATTVDLAAQGSFPNLNEGQTGTKFETVGGEWIGDWRLHQTTDQATGLTPNTEYTFRVKSRNADGIPTDWALGTATVRTLAAQPGALPYGPVTSQTVQANWSANGNPPGTEYFCRELITGRESGWITETSWILSGLEPLTNYHFQVIARNADGKLTDITDLGPVMTTETIGMVKMRSQVGERVRLSNKLVTAVFPPDRTFFIQEWSPVPQTRPEYASGIGVRWPDWGPITVREGDLVNITGRLIWNDPPRDQEVLILPDQVGLSVPGPFAAKPLGSMGRSLGGVDFGCQPGVFDDATVDPPVPSSGLNVIGTLIKAWGRIKQPNPENPFAYVEDGSRIADGVAHGIRINLQPVGGVLPAHLQGFGAVTGVMRCITSPAGWNVREIWPRSLSDFVRYPGPDTP